MPHETMRQDLAGIWDNEQFLKTCQKTEYKKMEGGEAKRMPLSRRKASALLMTRADSHPSLAGIRAVS